MRTFGGVLIRPLGDKPDSKMNTGDLGIFEQVEAWMTEHTGYATVSAFHEFLYEPDKPLHGDLSDYAYHQRGALAYVVELWDLFKQLGIERKKPFVDHYAKLTRKDMRALAAFDQHARLVDVPAKCSLNCSDPDDQKFIDLAVAQQALLLSKDRAVLSMAKRLLGQGIRALPAIE